MNQEFKVPSIYELVDSAYKDLKSKEKLLKMLEKDPTDVVIISSLKNEIENLKFTLSKFKSFWLDKLREEKINELGI